MTRALILAAIFLALISPADGLAGDWPFIQGSSFNGHADEEILLPAWDAGGPAVLWSRELGQGYSSFAVVGNCCVTQYQSPLGQYVVCLDAASGETLWQSRYALPYEALGIYPGPRATPTVVGQRVYFAAPDGMIGCLDLQTGNSLWSANPHRQFKGDGTGFGSSASPLVIGDLVILPVGAPGASIVALDAGTGQVRWAVGDDTASYCPTIPISLEGETLLVNYLENVITIHNLRGELLCRQSLSLGYDEHAAIPLYREPLLIVSAPFRAGATAYELEWILDEEGARKIQMRNGWQTTEMSNDIMTSVLCGDLLCGFDLRDPQAKAHRPSRGVFRGLDANTGITLWSRDDVGQAGAVAVGQQLILFNDSGEILLAEPDRTDLRILSRAKVFHDDVCWTRPVVSNGRLFLRTHSRAVCLKVGQSSGPIANESLSKLEDLPRAASLGWSWLLGGEREHPFTTIEPQEAWLWYLDCLGWCLLPAMLPLLFWRPSFAPDQGNRLLASSAFLFLAGMAATPLLNAQSPDFHFTWPAAIYAGFQAMTLFSLRATRQRTSRNSAWQARLALLLFLGLCSLYYQLLLWASEPMEWVFLLGLVPAFPLAVLTAQQATSICAGWQVGLISMLGFSAFYWSALGIQTARSFLMDQWNP